MFLHCFLQLQFKLNLKSLLLNINIISDSNNDYKISFCFAHLELLQVELMSTWQVSRCPYFLLLWYFLSLNYCSHWGLSKINTKPDILR